MYNGFLAQDIIVLCMIYPHIISYIYIWEEGSTVWVKDQEVNEENIPQVCVKSPETDQNYLQRKYEDRGHLDTAKGHRENGIWKFKMTAISILSCLQFFFVWNIISSTCFEIEILKWLQYYIFRLGFKVLHRTIKITRLTVARTNYAAEGKKQECEYKHAPFTIQTYENNREIIFNI